MSNMKNEVLVIDLGSYSIKALVAKGGSGGITVQKALTMPISGNIYANGDLQNVQELSSLIGDLVKQNNLKKHPVVFTFSSTSSFARVLEVPAVKPAEMKEVIDYEMQQYLPADPSAFVMQYRTLPGASVNSDAPLKVLVGGVPRVLAENFFAIVKNLELEPLALDIHPNAITKLISTAPSVNGILSIKEETVALIELGHSLMDINIFEKGEFQFNRRILIGGKNIDQRIERVLEVSIDDARMEKHNNADINRDVFEYTDENRVFNSVKTGVDEWVTEIEKVIKFYTSRKTGNHIDRFLLYGGGAAIKGIDQYMTTALSVETATIRSLPGFVQSSQLSEEQLPLYINALGALLREEGAK